jgi:cyclopropane fatty-acyl-phospholipid synthase-like methyltransferase
MSGPRSTSTRVGAERFERLYEASEDPWDYRSSAYERAKYAATLGALGSGRYGRALETGCSIGVFTELLAQRCDRLVGLDFSSRALALATERLAAETNVELVLGSFPEQAPAGEWDLVVCSEVLYYLDSPALGRALDWLEAQLGHGATVLAVSWRGSGETEPLRGDDVHDLLGTRLARWHAFDGRQTGYRLDRFDGHAA